MRMLSLNALSLNMLFVSFQVNENNILLTEWTVDSTSGHIVLVSSVWSQMEA